MPNLQIFIKRLDNYQRRHKFLAFSYAVIKKYGDDEAGERAALLTYYAFLSLFPLLLVLTTVTERIVGSHPHLEKQITDSVASYFPLLSSQLSSHVHGLHSSGLALVGGILLTLYGTRGVADAFRKGVQNLWSVPKNDRVGFPWSALKSLIVILVGGLGLILASISATFTGTAGHGLAFRGLSVAVNLLILFWLFTFLIKFCLPKQVTFKDIYVGAASAAIGLVILQTFGTYLLRHELKNLDALYSYFAVALALLFWLYLQAQVLYYSVEITVVSSRKLWPRSLTGASPTSSDKKLAAPQ